MIYYRRNTGKIAYCILILVLTISSLFAWGEQTDVRSDNGVSVSSLVSESKGDGTARHSVQEAQLPAVERFLCSRRFGTESQRLLSGRRRQAVSAVYLAAVLLCVCAVLAAGISATVGSLPVFGRSWSIITYIHAKDGKK